MKIFLAALLLLSGCTVTMVDKRLTREDVAAALKERDEAIALLAQKVLEMDSTLRASKVE